MTTRKPRTKAFALLKTTLIAALALSEFVTIAHSANRIEGQVLEKGTRKPLASVNVFVLPAKLKAVTGAEGKFRLDGVPEGAIEWVVNLTGYERYSEKDELEKGDEAETRKIYLERTNYQVYETTVFSKADKRDETTRSLKTDEFLTVPGAGGDPVKAVQNLPGVNRSAGFDSRVVIQGAAPEDTTYTIDGHDVPGVFHFGALTSVTFPEAVDRVDYLSAGYGPEFGRAMGGSIGLWTRNARKDRMHGLGFVDIFNAGALVETPIGEKSGLLIGVRQSYIGFVLKNALKNNEEFDLTVAPSFADASVVFDSKLTPKDDFRILTIGSLDQLAFLFSEPVEADPEFRGDFQSKTAFFRVIPQLTHRHGTGTVSRWSLGIGKDWVSFDIGDSFFYLNLSVLTTRAELEHALSPAWTAYWGVDNSYTLARADLDLPTFYMAGGVMNPFSTGETQQVGVNDKANYLGFYWRNVIEAKNSGFTFLPGVRADYFSPTGEFLPAPRVAVKKKLSESLSLNTAGGLYYQPPRPEQFSSEVGNPDLVASRAWHLTLGGEKDFRGGSTQGFTLSSNVFYRFFDRLIIQSSEQVERSGELVFEKYNNKGHGRAYGIETMLKLDHKPWSGWISYTLSRSTRWEPGQNEYLFLYDQTHNLNWVGSVDLPRNWRISTRVRFVSGDPVTPVVGGFFDADNDVFVPERGPFFSERLNPFGQVDLRVDKRWVFDTWILTAYLDIQNLTNRQNIEAVQYSYDYESQTKVAGLPLLPTFGLKGEF